MTLRTVARSNSHVFSSLSIHQAARDHQLDRDLIRSGGDVRITGRTETQPLERAISNQHSIDERDGILLSVSRRYACDLRWNYLVGPSGGCDPRALCLSSCWTLAVDLCGVRDDRTLLECLRSGCATLSKGAGTEGNGADPVRAAIRCHATCCT